MPGSALSYSDPLFFGVVGLGVVSLARFHILFSQQNREYGLWFTVCVLSTTLLLMANRTDKKIYWISYGVSVAICLYTFLFSLPFLASHFLFQWSEKSSTQDLRFRKFLIAAIAGITLYTPWLVNIFSRREMVEDLNKWSSAYLDPIIYLQSLILNFSRLFVDFNLPSFKPLPWDSPFPLISILLIVATIA